MMGVFAALSFFMLSAIYCSGVVAKAREGEPLTAIFSALAAALFASLGVYQCTML